MTIHYEVRENDGEFEVWYAPEGADTTEHKALTNSFKVLPWTTNNAEIAEGVCQAMLRRYTSLGYLIN